MLMDPRFLEVLSEKIFLSLVLTEHGERIEEEIDFNVSKHY